jgi:hypothetical protein
MSFKMSNLSIILIVFTLILIVAIILLIATNTRLKTEYINPKNCPQTFGTYGLSSGIAYKTINGQLAIINKCGDTRQQPCQVQVNGLIDATDFCDSNAHICDVFVYSAQSGLAYIVDPTTTLTKDQTYDTFKKIYNVTSL